MLEQQVAIVALDHSGAFVSERQALMQTYSNLQVLLVDKYTNLHEQVKSSGFVIVYYHADFVTERGKPYGLQTDELVRSLFERGIPVGTLYSDIGKTIYPRVKGDSFDRAVREPGLIEFLVEEIGSWLNE